MWCIVNSTTWSIGPRRTTVARSNGPCDSTNGRIASSPASRAVSTSRSAAGRSDRSISPTFNDSDGEIT
jgi:hypothetical protein